MDEQPEQRADPDAWPMPSRDVLRDLEPHAVAWPEPERGDTPRPAPSRPG